MLNGLDLESLSYSELINLGKQCSGTYDYSIVCGYLCRRAGLNKTTSRESKNHKKMLKQKVIKKCAERR